MENKTIEVLVFETNETVQAEVKGNIDGYIACYNVNQPLSWLVVSKADQSTVLASFQSQDDMEIMMKAELKPIKTKVNKNSYTDYQAGYRDGRLNKYNRQDYGNAYGMGYKDGLLKHLNEKVSKGLL
jgi:hypothetical protein